MGITFDFSGGKAVNDQLVDPKQRGPVPETVALTVHRVLIKAGISDGSAKEIGAVQDFSLSQSRNLEPIRGLGLGDRIFELVPGFSDPFDISISRAAFESENILTLLGYSFVSTEPAMENIRALNFLTMPFCLYEYWIQSYGYESGLQMKGQIQAGGLTINFGNNSFSTRAVKYYGCWINRYEFAARVGEVLLTEGISVNSAGVMPVLGRTSTTSNAGAPGNKATNPDNKNRGSKPSSGDSGKKPGTGEKGGEALPPGVQERRKTGRREF